jgi:hypothetical protein
MRVGLAAVLSCSAFLATLLVSERAAYSHKPITTPIIFKKEIAQIFQRKCFTCHSENNLAMPFTTYELARPWARAIREEVLERRMPPWGAVAGFGHFSNDVSLTPREMDIILSWADGGAPSGVLKAEESIPPVFVPAAPLWDAGPPDEVLSAEKATTLVPGSGDQVRRFEVRAAFSSPRAVRAIAFKPGDRRVVRYAAVYDSTTGRWLWTWTPWQTFMTLPDDVVYRLPARARLTVELGYRAIDETVNDTSELGLYFSDAVKAQAATAVVVVAPGPTTIAPGQGLHKVRAELTLPFVRRGIALWPELGEGATSLEVSIVSADGVQEPMVWVKDVRRDWPTPYLLHAPVPLARGSRMVMTAYFANAGDHPFSVTPRVTVVTVP